ncbi:MAG: hypothetical protein K2Q32_07435, partial [Alphaproteobacteria bacterium]|nr:hypothetical protein [Alphaproteobacteria bacterium]
MNRLSLWRAYVEGTPLAKTIPEARRGELFLDNGSFGEILLNKLMGTRHATIIPNDFFINHINLQHAPEIIDVNYPASEKLGLIARSALYQERHLLEDWPTFSDEDVANLIRHGRLPSAILLRGELDPSFQDVETQDVVILRQATRRHRFGQQVVAEFMGVSQESLGSTLPVDANDVADLLDIYALSIAAHDRGQSLLDIEDMFGQVSSTSVFNEAAH